MTKLTTLLFHDGYLNSPAGFCGPGTDRYNPPLVKFRAQLAAIKQARSDNPVLVTELPQADGKLPPFAISIDDGGLSYYSELAPCLAGYGWRGHCLITTGQLGRRGFLHKHHVRELHEAGHLIGSHSVTHPPRFDTCSWEQLVTEWTRSREDLEAIIGERVIVGSVPGGFYSRQVALAAWVAGLEILLTSEPQTGMHVVDRCRVFGRFTLHRDSPEEMAARLVRKSPGERWRQWAEWNGKKVLKKSLGSSYQNLAGWMAR